MSNDDSNNFKMTCHFSCSEPLCQTLDKVGVPADGKWRTLILYMRGIEAYDFLSESQKMSIQNLVLETLQQRDYSDEKFHEIMNRQEQILNSPCNNKLQSALSETAQMVEDFRKLMLRRGGDVQKLGSTTVKTLENGGDPDAMIKTLKESFTEIVEVMQRDAENLSQLSKTDGLTGLMNRRALDEYLENCIETWKNEEQVFSVMMIDIDHFKKFNDRFGHRIGDQALATVARLMKRQCQSLEAETVECFSARYGGEEFCMVLPLVEEEQAEAIADELRQSVERYNFIIRDSNGDIIKRNIHITVSIGVAQMNPEWRGAYLENVMDAADKALYKAKADGRNQVCRAGKNGQ